MVYKLVITIIYLYCLNATFVSAQTSHIDKKETKQDSFSKKDSLKQRRLPNSNELPLNQDAINSIRFDFLGNKTEGLRIYNFDESKAHSSFREDGTKSIIYVEMGKRRNGLGMYFNWNSHTDVFNQKEIDIRNRRVPTPIAAGNDAMQLGVGISIFFDAEKLLYENLTKQGRAIKHNQKYANAWKNYHSFIPTKDDSIKRDSTLILKDIYRLANDMVSGVADSLMYGKEKERP